MRLPNGGTESRELGVRLFGRRGGAGGLDVRL
jgi:hypothetical protein